MREEKKVSFKSWARSIWEQFFLHVLKFTRLMGFGWFNFVRDRDPKVRGPRARPGLVTLYQGRFVRTKVGPCIPGSARSLPACRSVFSFKQYIQKILTVEISDVFFMAILVVRVTKICFWLRRYF